MQSNCSIEYEEEKNSQQSVSAGCKSREYNCNQCSYTCQTKDTLQRYVKDVYPSVEQNEVFKYEPCNKTFSSKRILESHKKAKLQPKLLCDLCNLQFRRYMNLKRHMENKHKGI